MSRARVWILVTAAALVGFGVGFLMSRAWSPKSSAPPATQIASQLDLKLLLEKAVSERRTSAAPVGASYYDPASGLSGKHFAGLYQMKDPSRAESVSPALQKEVEAAIESAGGTIWNRGGGVAGIDDTTRMTYFERGYRLAGRTGTVHAWCGRRGEYVSVVLVFYEMAEALTPSAPQAALSAGPVR